MTPAVVVDHVSRRYRGVTALDDVSVAFAQGSITGLLGRNGAGKSTLMRVITAQEFASAGTVLVHGRNPVEHDDVLRRMSFVKESQVYPDIKVKRVIEAASWFYPDWNHELAGRLIDDFNLPLKRPVKKLSRGLHSAVGIVIGLASRAEITLFDEPYLGLDAVARQIFYDRLLEDYAQHPRTVLLSTHLIDEVANLLEHVVVISAGRIVVDEPADRLRGRAVTVSGPAAAVEDFVGRREVIGRQGIGSLASATVTGPLDDLALARAREMNLQIEPVSLQEYVVRTVGSAAGPRSMERIPA
ncbi:ABC transporter ATP-binding protein [Nakamurella sp.]|uniref:ABC transporter ATP-binding protein n=1 Tax=Nakamurella sp. TaxID=1869182 RepID=UPI003B3AD63D